MTISTTVSSCRAVILSYTDSVIKGDSADLSVKRVSIERECLSFEYSKNIAQAAGTFTLQVTAEINWKKRIFPGDWIVVYLSNEGIEYRRMVGNIDRVSQFTTKNEVGLLETSYVISGRDFGKVFEETQIWYNAIDTVSLLLGQIPLIGSPTELIQSFVDIYLGAKLKEDAYINQPQLKQWFIPGALFSELGMLNGITGQNRFYDLLTTQIQKVSGYKAIENLATIQGNLWQILKSNSNEILNELYVELYDEKPHLFLRTRPFARRGFTLKSITEEILYFEELRGVVVKGSDIIGMDLGVSSDDRYNVFLMTSQSDLLKVDSLNYGLQPEFPDIQLASIQRNGLKIMYTDTDFAIVQGDDKNRKYNPGLLLDWNRLIKHWYNNGIFMEAGTINLVKANPYIRVGETLTIKDSTVNQDKIFYTEGYTDSWSYPGAWNQTVFLTRGQYIKNGRTRYIYIEDREDTIYTGQTKQTRAGTI